jgi:hypothetical protein
MKKTKLRKWMVPETNFAAAVLVNAFGPARFADANRALLSMIP